MKEKYGTPEAQYSNNGAAEMSPIFQNRSIMATKLIREKFADHQRAEVSPLHRMLSTIQ
jgi:hypothetical protein